MKNETVIIDLVDKGHIGKLTSLIKQTLDTKLSLRKFAFEKKLSQNMFSFKKKFEYDN